ncbi:RIB43A-like with coiled-coils protein 2 [Chelonus insularis]|uniref:RIB43A-like with coiled-coils protein 2 n=1 Tax=Chelonus insularis TaxID=460826 RepID=UPI00158CCDF0|nr:RIB43A-like with coiled-coils protein 2 [Chelonus insularis]
MFKFDLTTQQDLKVVAKVEKRRQVEETRKRRIFNPRIRQIGIDREFLDKQIKEKQKLRQHERERECRMDEALVRSSQFAIMLEKQQEEERKVMDRQINNFRQIYQRPQDRRDYDLYDPDRLKKTIPARISDDDPRLGPASAQKFDGEDIKRKARLKDQKEQMQSWLMQQVYEKRKNEQEQQNVEESFQQLVISRDRRAIELERIEEECRRRLNEANAQFNRTLAEEQEYRRRCEAIKDEEDKRAEIYNHVTGDFLTEAREQAESICGPYKPLTDRYKGMSSDELKVIQHEQARQMQEIQRMRQEEKHKNEEWNRIMLENMQIAEKYYEELNQKDRETRKQIAAENLQLAQQQKSRQNYLNTKVYKYQPKSEFFDKFNSCAR